MYADISRAFQIQLAVDETELHELLMELKPFVTEDPDRNTMLIELYEELTNALDREKGKELL
jgi:hypothetical protein